MNRHGRLDRLYAELTALERARLAIDAIVLGEPEDRQLRLTMPAAQRDQFDTLMRLGRQLIRVARDRASRLSLELDGVRARATLLRVVIAWGAERYLLFSYLEDAPICPHCNHSRCDRLADMRMQGPSHPSIILVAGGESDRPVASAIDAHGRELVRELRADIQDAWAELLALETVETWVAERFDDAEFADRVLGGRLHEIRAGIEEAREYASDALGEFELPPADPELLAYAQDVLHPGGQRTAGA